MAENALPAEIRSGTGKGVARKLRAAGRIPAVLYGSGKASQALAVDPRALDQLLHKSSAGLNTLISLQIEGAARTVLLKDLQRDPVKGSYLHADFHEIDLTETVEVSVPLHFVGKARGEEMGGVVDHPLREIDVECLPTAIPEFVEVDVSRLEIGDSIHVSDLPLPEGVTLRTETELVVAHCVPPTREEEPTEALEGEAAAEAPAPAEGGGPAEG